MEERILHSADLAPLLVAEVGNGVALQQPLQTSANDAQTHVREIVFIDLSVPDAEALLADLRMQRDTGRALEIITITPDQDGLALITDTLALRHDVTAVHVLAHGSDGILQLGNTRLDAQNLLARAAEVAGWGAALTADADLLLYGCDFAQTAIGQQMVRDLAALTGADVAASSDPTGAVALGGNWLLEQRSGSIEATSAASATLQQAWGGLLGNDFQVNSKTSSKQSTDAGDRGGQQAVAYDASGKFVVVWTSDNQDGDKHGVYARRFDALGNALTGEVRVAQTTDEEQRDASVASDAAGNFVVTWRSNDDDDDKGDDVYMRRFGAAGNALTNEIRVNTTTSDAQVDSAIGMNASTGDFVIAWEGEGTDDSAGVFFRRFSANGSALDASEKRGNQTSIGTEQNAAVAMDTSGRFVIAFDVGNHTYFQRFDAAGTAQGSRTQVDSLLGSNGGAAIAMDGAGNFTIVYRENNLSPGVWGRGFNVDGSQRYDLFNVDSGNADSPSIAMAGDGSFIVGYHKAGTGRDIFTRLYTAGGNPVAAGAIVNQYTPNEQTDPSVALFGGTNHYVAVWSGKSATDGDGVSARIFAAAPMAPVVTTTAGTLAYVENDGPRAIDAGMVVTDADSAMLASATIRITANFSSGQDMLVFTNQNGITGSWNAGTGVLALSGSASVANYQAALRSVTYTNTSDAPAIATRTVSFVVSDGQANSVAANRSIGVIARNDAPTGASKAITLLEDASYAFTVADFGYADPLDVPANALLNVRIITLPLTGSLKLDGVVVAANQFVSASDIGLGRLVFTPLANASGASYAGFDFQVQDNGGTANGGVDLDPVARTITLNVTPVNDAPVGSNKTVTVLEDASYTFAATDFGFNDPNDTTPNALINVRITSLPVAGSLTLAGSAVAVNQFVSLANINAGNLKFAPMANASGASYASFGFRVQDGGGTANGGVDLDTTSRTMTVDVTPVNDAPSGSDFASATLEDVSYVFSLGDFGFSDTRDVPSDTLFKVKIATLPISGNLQLNGVAVIAGQFVSASDIGNGKLAFVPVANANASNYASFTFQVQDDGGADNGGADLDPMPRIFRIDVTAVDDAPVGTSKTVVLAEDTSFVFSVADFGFTDPNDSPANTLTDVRIVGLPLLGNLTLSGAAVTSNQLISVTSINAGNLRYTALPNANGNAYASFTFTVRDNGGISNGGVIEDVTARTMTLDVTAVNDAPLGTVPAAQNMASNTTLEFSSTGGNAIVISDVDAGGAVVHLTLSVGTGNLTLSGISGLTLDAGTTGTNNTSMGFSGTLAAINAALDGLQFFPGAVFTGSTTLSIVSDDLDNSGSGGAKSSSSNVVVNVSFVNAAPVLSGSANLQAIFEDPASNAGTSLETLIGAHVSDSNLGASYGIAVTGVINSNGGDWQYSGDGGVNWNSFGNPGLSNARLLAANGQTFVRFVPGANWNGVVSNGLTFRAWDETSGTAGGTANTSANGGTSAFSIATASASVTVLPVNDAPVGADHTVSMFEHAVYTFARTDFGLSDPIDSPAHTLLGVRISSLPAAGALTFNGVAATALDFVTVAELDSGKLVFTPTANGNGVGFASFGFQVRDDGGTTNGGLDTDPTMRTMTVDVASVNDAPQGADRIVATREDQSYQFTLADFAMTDVDDAPANQLLSVHITTVPATGRLTLSGVAVASNVEILASDILAGKLLFVSDADGNGAGYASFQFQLQDDGGIADGGADRDPTPRTMTIDVVAVNDAPTGSDTTRVIQEDNSHTFSRADFGFSDPLDLQALPTHLMRAVRIDTLPVSGSLTLDGQLVAAGQFISVADVDALLMVFTPAANANGMGYASLTFRVQDDGGTASGGVDLDLFVRTITFDVTAVNDAPLAFGSASLGGVAEDTLAPAGASVGALYMGNFSDAVDAAAPAGNALAGVAVQTLTLDAAQGRWQYSIDGGGSWSDVGAVSESAALSLGINDRLRFLPAPDYSGTPNALTVRLIDDSVLIVSGGAIDVTSHGGATAISVGVVATGTQILSLNDAPIGQDRTVSIREDASYVFSLADFDYFDTNDLPANAFIGVRISSVPLRGSLTLAGAAVTALDFVTVAELDSGKLVFTPTAHGNGVGFASFGFQVRDDGGTADGGLDTDPTVRTMTIDVAPVNDAPQGADRIVATREDQSYQFTLADFAMTDVDDTPADQLLSVHITAVPAAGRLTLSGVAVASDAEILASEILAGKLLFVPDADGSGAGYASFQFQLQDDGGIADGGADRDPTPRTMTIDVVAVNDAPTLATSVADQTATQGQAFTLTIAANSFVDVDSGDTLTYSASLAGGGAWPSWLGFDAGTQTFSGTPGNGDAGELTIRVTATDSASLSVFDEFTLTVTSANEAPSITAPATITVTEDIATALSGISFTDVDAGTNPVTATFSVASGSLAATASGAVGVSGSASALILTGSVSDINLFLTNGQLAFTTAPDATANVTLIVTINDAGHTGSGDALSATTAITLQVTAVNDAPTVAIPIANQTASRGQAFTLTIAPNSFVDVDSGDTLTYSASLAGGGTWPSWLGFNASARTFSGTPGNGDAGELTIRVSATDSASLSLSVFDEFTLTVDSANDPPSITAPARIAVTEDTAMAVSGISFADVDAGTNPVTATFTVGSGALSASSTADVSVAGNASALTFNGSIANINAFIAAGALEFVGAPHGADAVTLAISISDNGNTGSGGPQSVSTVTTLAMTAVNDAPSVSVPVSFTVTEDTPLVLTGITFADVDAGGSAVTATFGVGSGMLAAITGGGVSVAGSPTALSLTGTVIDINSFIAAGNLGFTPATDMTSTLTLTTTINDNGHSGIGGALSAAALSSLTVSAVNDAPTVSAPAAMSASEDVAVALSGISFTDVDAGTNPVTATFSVASGSLAATDSAGVAVTGTASALILTGSVSDINDFLAAGQVTFTTQANATAAVTLNVTINDAGHTGSGGALSATTAITLQVTAVNDAPILATPIPNQTATEGQPFTRTIAANSFVDVDSGDTMTYSARQIDGAALPAWLRFDAASRTFSGTPASADVGVLSVRISAIDNALLAASADFVLTVANVNDVPTLGTPLGDLLATVSQTTLLQLPAATFVDADAGDALQYSATLANGSSLPAWLTFDAATRTFTVAPTLDHLGTTTVRVVATDTTGASAQLVFNVLVGLAPDTSITVVEPEPAAPAADKPKAAQAEPEAAAAALVAEASEAESAPAALDAPVTGIDVLAPDKTQVIGFDTGTLVVAQRQSHFADVPTTPAAPPAPLLAAALLSQLGDITLSSSSQGYLQSDDMMRKLEEMRRQMAVESSQQQMQVATAIALSSSLSIGYVVWLIRGGVLVSSMLSALPAWQMLDPLPIIASSGSAPRKGRDSPAEDREVERLFDENAGVSRTAPPAKPSAAPATDGVASAAVAERVTPAP